MLNTSQNTPIGNTRQNLFSIFTDTENITSFSNEFLKKNQNKSLVPWLPNLHQQSMPQVKDQRLVGPTLNFHLFLQ